ncbi:Murein DD-endopeptidase MepM and murein hydrolase activator NlpD, contain LysM domain [Desulfonispora thiosulfatigenes DSM 11270]|uniref:Murein DD-endopeptidase MepM and murein hydrolase activator NlpD, contain LysM domain n=1 Tax=Desulfonispora thiosulfatigenes DSM 11270 TaxID=656914 RepID=A0A1W1VSA5_DESTI|nr:M23 family metallopeptidase [Desulfonispora thiosulfatigenes]SMB96163.1 Murein DD-endopeptidase MepM and murein hydrolase activator NlpD, contain LysM domain [Desulfonispora thiosulfatigenes DSM 11270]
MLTTLEQERKILDTKKRKLEAVKKDIAYLKSSRESKKEELRMASINKQELVKVLDTEKKSYEQGLNDIEKQSRQITSQIQKLQSSSSGSKPSNMLWPTPGYTRITSPYGWRNHPILNSKRFHTGIDIAAPHGANAVAVASGKVIFVGWNGAYGNTVIIDHGGGISTLYAHLSSFIVSTGTQVSVNQSVARIGSTGWSTGPHLHFEVRNNGNHINPYSFLK